MRPCIPSYALRQPLAGRLVAQYSKVQTAASATTAPKAAAWDTDDWKQYDHTQHRWLWNERKQLAQRRVRFNEQAMARKAVETLGSVACVKIEKLAEGQFNKAFLVTMDDGRQLIAKVPNPNAGFKQFITASEVATMDYVRNVLQLPIPAVLAWDPAAANAVGSEYILMERAEGIELQKVWQDMSWRQRLLLAANLAEYEAKMALARFDKYGSLYYAADLRRLGADAHRLTGGLERFAIGQTMDRTFFDDKRSEVSCHRGPWSSLEDYSFAVAERELKCLERFQQFPEPRGLYNGPGQYRPTTAHKTEVLQNFLKVARYMKPKEARLSRPMLWHTDLHLDNIFVKQDDPTIITSIIDWQSVKIAPAFLQARHPHFMEFAGEVLEPLDQRSTALPNDYDTLSNEEKKKADERKRWQSMWKMYEVDMYRHNREAFQAMRFSNSIPAKTITIAGNVFSDGEIILEEFLIEVQERWNEFVLDVAREPCPLHYSEDDKAAHRQRLAHWGESVQLMTDFIQHMGAFGGWSGWVTPDQYEEAMKSMASFKEKLLDGCKSEEEKEEWLAAWPFQDD